MKVNLDVVALIILPDNNEYAVKDTSGKVIQISKELAYSIAMQIFSKDKSTTASVASPVQEAPSVSQNDATDISNTDLLFIEDF